MTPFCLTNNKPNRGEQCVYVDVHLKAEVLYSVTKFALVAQHEDGHPEYCPLNTLHECVGSEFAFRVTT